jgi:type IV secretion system T-DNA border endonuclease VirD1
MHHNIDPAGYKIVSVRLREAEFESFSDQVQLLGLTNNLALRIAARRISGFLEIDFETRRILDEISREIGHLSQAIFNLNRKYSANGTVDLKEFKEHCKKFGLQFAKLDTQLGQILNTTQRRNDGRQLLQAALDK